MTTRLEGLKLAREGKTVPAWVNSLLGELQTHKWKTVGTDHSKWNRYLDIIDGDQIRDRAFNKPGKKHNMTRQLIDEQKPTLTEVGVNIEAAPRQPDDGEKASLVQDVSDYGFELIDIKKLDKEAGNWSLDLGAFVGKTWWDADGLNGIGTLKAAILDPRTVYFDEHATCVDDASIIIVVSMVSVDRLKKRYKDKAEKISTSDHESLAGSTREKEKRLNSVPSIEVWIRDLEADESSQEREGWVINTVGDVLLNDRENPFKQSKHGHGKFPFFMGRCFDMSGGTQPWGRGYVETLDADQSELDELETMIAGHTRLMSMPWVIIPGDTKKAVSPSPATVARRMRRRAESLRSLCSTVLCPSG